MEETNVNTVETLDTVATTDKKYIPKKEFWMFAVGGMGQGMIYAIMSSYISEFYLNVAFLPAVFVLLLMLLARVWDAINDPIMGMVIDRTTTRWGKFKPYVLFTPIPVAILTFLMFFVPEGLNKTQLCVYAAFTYTLWGMIYTVSDVPFWSLPNAMTPDPKERGNTISFGRTLNGVGSAVPMVLYAALGFLLPLMTNKTGVEFDKLQYIVIALTCAILGSAVFISSYFFVKERVVIPNKAKRDKSEPGSLKRIFTCKPLMLVVSMGVLSSGRYLVQAAATHVARYSFYIGKSHEVIAGEAVANYASALASNATQAANIEAYTQELWNAAVVASRSTISTVFMVCAAVGMFGAMLFMPAFFKRFEYKRIVIVSCVAGAIASVIMTLVGWFLSFWACVPFIIIMSIPLGVLNVTSYAMVGDCLDYMEWQTGVRDTALGSACQGFVNKLGNALATCMIVIIYLSFSIDPGSIVARVGLIDPTTQPDNVRFGMFSLVSIIPGISLLLCAIPIFFYDITGDKKAKITSELAAMRAEKGIVIE